MNTAIIYTWTSSGGSGSWLSLWWWTNDWGTFHAFQVAPSLNQGFNFGAAAVTEVRSFMPPEDPGGPVGPQLAYITFVTNRNSYPGVSMFDVYAAWQ